MNKINKTNKITLGILSILMVSLMVSSIFAHHDSSRNEYRGKALDRERVLDRSLDLEKVLKIDVDKDFEIKERDLEDKEGRKRDRAHLLPSETSYDKDVRVYLSPKKQIAHRGEPVTYKVVIKDNHPKIDCRTVDLAPGAVCPLQYEYKLDFDSRIGVKGELEQEKITLSAGERKVILLTVSSKKAGANKFIVRVEGEDTGAKTKGILFVPRKPKPMEATFFIGSGYAVNKDETKGILIDLSILKIDNNLKGKISMFGDSFILKGKTRQPIEGTESYVEFEYTNPQGIHYGRFSGTVRKFSSFLLLKGDLTFKDETYKLTTISKNRIYIRKVSFDKKDMRKKTIVRLKDTIVLTHGKRKHLERPIAIEGSVLEVSDEAEELEEETYINPLKIRRKRFLGLFPYGKKILYLEVIKGDKVIKKTIRAKERKRFDGLDIRVGSLEDKNNIELTIEEIEEA